MKKKKRTAPPRAKPGVARQHLLDVYSTIPESHTDLKIGHVLSLFLQNERSKTKTAEVVSSMLPGSCLVNSSELKCIQNKFESFSKHLSREAELQRYILFCGKLFKSYRDHDYSLRAPSPLAVPMGIDISDDRNCENEMDVGNPAEELNMQDHTILLLQTDPKTKTFSDYETCQECLEDICKIYEDHLRKSYPHNQSITYDISQLFDFVDKFTDMSCLVYDHNTRAYVPHAKGWIKEQVYILMRKQAQRN